MKRASLAASRLPSGVINVRKPGEERAEAFIANANHSRPEETSKVVVNIRFDDALLARIDADALRLGINRRAWLHVAANGMLERAKIAQILGSLPQPLPSRSTRN